MGRKKIQIDPEDVERLAARGLAEYQIAEELGVSPETLERRKADTDGIAGAIKRGRRAARGAVENVAFECAKLAGRDPRYQTAMIFWLKTQAGWKERQVIETVETDGAGESRDDIVRRIRGLFAGKGSGADPPAPADGDD